MQERQKLSMQQLYLLQRLQLLLLLLLWWKRQATDVMSFEEIKTQSTINDRYKMATIPMIQETNIFSSVKFLHFIMTIENC
ncbi:hypothetical protein C0J52_24046 [Blattella germanica]|nr:hypothetical protein C0J52_24046 [Blattella germanica]